MRKLTRLSWFLTLSVFLVVPVRASASKSGELSLAAPLMHEINQVLKTGTSLHKALVAQDDEQIEIGLRDVLWQIERTRQASVIAKPHDRGHLLRILDAAKEQFTLTRSSYGQERRARLEDGFNQLVNLVRIYKVDHTYAIVFCPKDRTTWVQTGARVQNPFRTEASREPCGIKVPR